MEDDDTEARTDKAQSEKAAGLTASKLKPRYWQPSLFRPTYGRVGTRTEVNEWYCQIQHAGRREKVALASNSREEAARKAARLDGAIRSKGWAEALR